MITFTSDPAKARRNLRKHRLSFKTGEQVFADPFIIVFEDCEDTAGELRYMAVGRAHSETLLAVTFVDRLTANEEIHHIISVRKAEEYEKSAYFDQF